MTPGQFIAKWMTGRCFFHFTDTRNLANIRLHGLLSLKQLENRGIAPLAPGGNQWSHDADRQCGLDRYVHLCFFNQHPMEYVAREEGRLGDTVFIKVHTSVLEIPGILFCNDVSNKSGATTFGFSEIEKLDLEVCYRRLDWTNPDIKARLKAAKKYELLIPDSVPANLLSGI